MSGEARAMLLAGLRPVPDLSAVRCRARLLEMFVISVADKLAGNGKENKPGILLFCVRHADIGSRWELTACGAISAA